MAQDRQDPHEEQGHDRGDSVSVAELAQEFGAAPDASLSRPERPVRVAALEERDLYQMKERRELRWMAFVLCGMAFGFLLVAFLGVLLYAARCGPSWPDPAAMDEKSLTAFKECLDAWHTHVADLKQSVIQAGLPVIMAILGYLFAKGLGDG